MIFYLQGRITFIAQDFVVLDIGGVGYKIFLSKKSIFRLAKNKNKAKFFISLYLRQNRIELYGFLSQAELELFEILNDISGIGPKTALTLAEFGSLEKLKTAIETNQLRPEAIKGIGKKKLQKIMLEITGKIKELSFAKSIDDKDEALQALISLGIPKKHAKQVLNQLPQNIVDNAQKIKEALKIISRSFDKKL